MAGMLLARLPELGLPRVEDRRKRSGLRWPLPLLLTAAVLGIMCGCQSVAEVEELTRKLPVGIRRRLKLPPVKDTTLREALVRLHPYEVREVLERLVKAAFRREALDIHLPELPFVPVKNPLPGEEREDALPFHAASMDGKAIALHYWDGHYAQQRVDEKRGTSDGLVRVVNSVLSTSKAKVVLDALPIPADTNEMGLFPHALEALVRKYGQHFDMVLYDAGAASEANMDDVLAQGKSFLFCLADERWGLYQKAQRVLGARPEASVRAQTEDVESKTAGRVKVRRLYVATAPNGYRQWRNVHTLLRLESYTTVHGKVVADTVMNRYFASSLQAHAITPRQWMALIRTRWGVENNLHWTLNTILQEAKHPWIEAAPRGTVVVMLLRRIAYSLLALFRSVTLHPHAGEEMPWKQLLDWVYDALMAAHEDSLEALRPRKQAAATS